jgi:hypothetical protein
MAVRFENASWDPEENIFVVPGSIMDIDGDVHLQVFPNGLDSEPYDAPAFLFDSFTHAFDAGSATGLGPVTASGESQGVFLIPGQT